MKFSICTGLVFYVFFIFVLCLSEKAGYC